MLDNVCHLCNSSKYTSFLLFCISYMLVSQFQHIYVKHFIYFSTLLLTELTLSMMVFEPFQLASNFDVFVGSKTKLCFTYL